MLVFKDDFFKFYTEKLDNPNMTSLEVTDAYNGFVFRHNFLSEFKIEKVFHGKSGTYEYYKVTFQYDNVGQELVLLVMSRNILKPIYLDDKYADLSATRLRVSTKKGGLSIRRVKKK